MNSEDTPPFQRNGGANGYFDVFMVMFRRRCLWFACVLGERFDKCVGCCGDCALEDEWCGDCMALPSKHCFSRIPRGCRGATRLNSDEIHSAGVKLDPWARPVDSFV